MHPAPVELARPATADELPRTAAALQRAATAAGFATAATYAKGSTLARDGGPGRVVESVLLRLRRTTLGINVRAAGEWIDNRFDNGWIWTDKTPLRKAGAKDLRSLVKEWGQ